MTENTTLRLRLQESLAHLSYWPRTIRLVWTAAPGWTVCWSILLVAQGVLPATTVYLTKLLVDSLVVALGSGGDWQYIRPALFLLVLTAGVTLLSEVLQSLIDWVRAAQSELVQDYIKGLVHEKAVALDLSFYESSDYHDLLERVRSDAGTRPLSLLENCGGLIQSSITLLAMAAILMSYNRWLPLILFISTLPAFYVVLHFDRQYHQWWRQTTTDRRRIQYYDLMLTHSEPAAEIRLFGLGAHFQTAYQTLRQRLREERLRQLRKQSLGRLGAGAAALIVMGLTMGWMVWRAIIGLLTLGDLALFYQAFNRGQGLMRSLLASLGQIYTNTVFLGNLFAFLELKPDITDPAKIIPAPQNPGKGIHFRNIAFRYPGNKQIALKDFNLFVPAGKVVAIVGPNGAGKTTLLKLLCRLYDPESGSVEIDGIDIRDLSIEELRRTLTILFQFPINFHATVANSIALGDHGAAERTDEIEAAARSAGVHDLITRLPHGYDTMLGKWFADGVELSGGEWQKIAMARAYMRRSPIIVLDEPTSFMDSWSEADWFERFRSQVKGRTGIIITHRFTIAMRADIIHVMQDGEIVESGSHHELLSLDGLYAQSWAAQVEAASATAETDVSGEAVLQMDLSLQEVELQRG